MLKNDDRFNSFSKHLSPVERAQARTLLENQRSQLSQRMRDYLMGAYGAQEPCQVRWMMRRHWSNRCIRWNLALHELPIGGNLGKGI